MDLNDLVKLNKIFLLYEKIDDAFDFINGLFNENKIYLKEILNNEILFCVLQFYLPNGKTQEAIIKLFKKDLNKDSIIDNLCKNLNDLKNEFNNYKKETNERISKLENLVNQLLLDKKPENEFKTKINSSILNYDDYNFIINRIKEDQLFKNKSIKTRLLYKALKDWDDQKIFHEKCDGISNTLVIVHTKEDLKFGGFTTAKWNNKDREEKDDHAFCFNLNNKKIFNIIKGKNAIKGYECHGPGFSWNIFYIYDNCLKKGGECNDKSNNCINYDNQSYNYEINNGKNHFDTLDYEVHEIIFD